ncbi:MAG: SpaA isopeptide-forming pilin-related protein [Syntrophomonadaceae bacterium]|nr:SpaA isopeptide-forming pilin-related protein [Syntrophomonadaceae bacterium]
MYTTNANGEITINKVRIGDYSLIEKSTNKWYNLASDTNVIVEWNTTKNTTIENELKKGQIKVVKIDKDNNEIKLQGVKFNVLDENNRVLETIMTDTNGEALTSRYAIRDYSKLKIQECQTLSNYVLNNEIKTVELKEEQIENVTFENELKKGQIKVIKVDLDDNEVKLKGVEFKVIDEDGKQVETLITDENGEAVSKKLRIDKEYTLQESKTLSNYVLNENEQTVILQENQITDVTFENELKKGQIKIIKVDKDNNEVKLQGVEFKVIDEDGKQVDTLITDENGEAVSKKIRIDKEYTLQESKTLSNYVLNEEIQKVILQENQITEKTFENEKIKGYIQVTKTSFEDNQYSKLKKGSLLENATFEVYDEDNNLVHTITTDSTGKAITKEVLKGKYKIKEKNSPIYYILNTNTYNAEIINNQEIVNADITNDNVILDIEIQKNGFIETQSKDDIFYNFKNIKNNSNVPLDNFTWSDNLSTDAVRINRIYTGTWNENLEYAVYYKTNKTEEYILFKDKLNTQKIYELDFKELKLDEDEYVTDYEFRFETVKIGFQEIESPILYCDILDGLGNGYIFINNTKVFGTYYEAYIEAKDKWTTITYFKEIQVLETLPRTR